MGSGGPSKEELAARRNAEAEARKAAEQRARCAELEAEALQQKAELERQLEQERRRAENARREAEMANMRDRHEAEMQQQQAETRLETLRMQLRMQQEAAESERANVERLRGVEQQMQERLDRMREDSKREFEEWTERNRQLQTALDQMQKSAADAEARFAQTSDVKTYDESNEKIFQQFLNNVERMDCSVERTKRPSLAIVGQNGVGKSSLINAIAGKEVTEVGVVDTTVEVSKVFESDKAEFYDVPGCSEERSYANLKYIHDMKKLHLIVVCYIDRCEHILKLERLIKALKVPYLVVRNKVDLIRPDAKKGLSATQVMEQAYAVESKKVQGKLIYVSAHSKEGFELLRAQAAQLAVELQ